MFFISCFFVILQWFINTVFQCFVIHYLSPAYCPVLINSNFSACWLDAAIKMPIRRNSTTKNAAKQANACAKRIKNHLLKLFRFARLYSFLVIFSTSVIFLFLPKLLRKYLIQRIKIVHKSQRSHFALYRWRKILRNPLVQTKIVLLSSTRWVKTVLEIYPCSQPPFFPVLLIISCTRITLSRSYTLCCSLLFVSNNW